jgi:hypothetical protein
MRRFRVRLLLLAALITVALTLLESFCYCCYLRMKRPDGQLEFRLDPEKSFISGFLETSIRMQTV